MRAPEPLSRDVKPERPSGKAGGGHPAITVRDRRFNRGGTLARWWANGDPVATAWFTALSGTFPRGEAYFIEAVKAHREGAPPHLAEAIRAFVQQEANHTREHLALNRLAAETGYDMAAIDRNVAEMIALLDGRPKILDLASTMALEHYTAMLAHDLLAHPDEMAGIAPAIASLWRWHAIEEIEHKAVAFDTWLHATREWTAARRWRVRSLMMLIVTHNFLGNRIRDALALMAQDGITGWPARWRLLRFLFGRPGPLRRIFPAWLAYFRPGFHPWDVDDRHLASHAEAQAGTLVPTA